MLFNSYIFIFAFLPLALLLFHGLRRFGHDRGAVFVLAVMSLFFYGWWSPKYLLLLIPLMLVNYGIANALVFYRSQERPRAAKLFFILGLCINLAALGYFKYANFFVDNVNALFGTNLFLATIVLPLGISFFTFQKIALLVDVYYGKVGRLNLLDFSLFVAFFPQLIAGPIVHHSEVMPQFKQLGRVQAGWVALGVTIFAIGLAKKVLLADTAANYATPQFNAVAAVAQLDFIAAWSAALAYTAQLYFDFSAYSDMAIGIGLLFGIRLPLNFASPYKAANIIDFWRRWHMTLSRFLRDYLYIALGGNRKGEPRRYVNLFLTMLLGGIWHGAGWTFVVWGALHGSYLIINHGWREMRKRLGLGSEATSLAGRRLAQLITFLAVVVAWVFFRAADMGAATSMINAMAGNNGIAVPASLVQLVPGWPASTAPVDGGVALLVALALLLLAWLAPNTQQITGYLGPEGAYGSGVAEPGPAVMRWNGSLIWAICIGSLFAVSLMLMSRVSEFIYFQF
ncbi:Peptidoglycan O-acetyltransferase [Methylophilaceae bacterium]|nr:Peptidoglycan O-acetyltransferase [Methylophilaceae bacterium]